MNYKEVIESKYNRQKWQLLLYDIFGSKADLWASPYEISTNSDLSKQTFWLGTITLTDGETIAVYEVELSDKVEIERNRRGIRDMLLSEWRNRDAGAFMFCYRKDESVLRFSYVSETWGFNKQGEYEKVSTDTKRYTYLLGENRGCRTAIDQFTKLKESKQTLRDITSAFSVEALTKEFYNDLFEWFQWAIEPSSNVSFPNDTTFEDDDRDDIEKKIIRLITRIMFVWFIKQKDLVPHRIFDIDFLSSILKDFNPVSESNGNYYNAILQNLFFATLNREIVDEEGNKRRFAKGSKKDIKTLYRYAELFKISENEVIDLFSEVPFLNGGLFECLDKTKTIDGVERAYNLDGFSRNNTTFLDGRYCHRAVIPNILFFEPEKGLISILNRYNFTIEENSPEEQQVALDPELLGKVFENLLGAYNPETKETARNQSGSFYTPREIVNYMVDESLIAYLGDNETVRSVFSSHFIADANKSNEYQDIVKKLKAVKVIDPACGSGAFPMGLLNRMVDIIQKLSPDEDTYELKLNIIENCIYGSDIQSIATQISKLRFFISLICDCEKDASKPNYGIPTLPNLETKFVAANSLIDRKNKGQYVQGNLFVDNAIMELKDQLKKCRHEHFKADTASKKIRLRKQDAQLRKELTDLLSQGYGSQLGAEQLAAWNPYDQNTVSPFFDPEWMFGITDGFDIVIGNPPYIQLQNNGGELAQLYQNCDYETFARTGDIYCLFYERGWQLLKEGGHLCYITSNKWMRAGYGEKTRGFFATKTNPKLLIDFAGVKIFESATVDTNILLFSRSTNQKNTICAVTNKQNGSTIKNLSDFVQQQHSVCDFGSSDSWVILSPIEQSIKHKIESVGTPLKDWDINIYRGVLTGYNDAFIINTEKRDEILAKCQSEDEHKRTAELIRPILRGRDIKRYGYDWANLWLIYIPWHFPYQFDETIQGASEKAENAFMALYPSVYSHMLQYKVQLSNRNKAETGIRYEWYAMQRWGAKYWEDFSKPKLVYMEIQTDNPDEGYPFPCYSYDDTKAVTLNMAYIMSSNSIDVRYVLGILNSKLGKFLVKLYVTQLQERQFRMLAQYVQNFPIVKTDPSIVAHMVELVNNSITKDRGNYDREINELSYTIYNLTDDEIRYLENK